MSRQRITIPSGSVPLIGQKAVQDEMDAVNAMNMQLDMEYAMYQRLVEREYERARVAQLKDKDPKSKINVDLRLPMHVAHVAVKQFIAAHFGGGKPKEDADVKSTGDLLKEAEAAVDAPKEDPAAAPTEQVSAGGIVLP